MRPEIEKRSAIARTSAFLTVLLMGDVFSRRVHVGLFVRSL